MKKIFLTTIAAFCLALSTQYVSADETNDLNTELKNLDHRIVAKFHGGKATEQDLTTELKQFDTLLAEHQGEKPDNMAEILNLKAAVYKIVLHESDKYDEVRTQIEREYPDSEIGLNLRLQHDPDNAAVRAQILRGYPDSDTARQLRHKEIIQNIQAKAAVGKSFPVFAEKDLSGQPLAIANYKGKVVLIDFWATWCGPCKAELPNVLKIYNTYHDRGFEVIGVSLDGEESKLKSFVDQHKLPWPQYFDGLGWKNKLAVKYGVEAIPATYLLDGDGNVIGTGLRGEALETAVAAALQKAK